MKTSGGIVSDSRRECVDLLASIAVITHGLELNISTRCTALLGSFLVEFVEVQWKSKFIALGSHLDLQDCPRCYRNLRKISCFLQPSLLSQLKSLPQNLQQQETFALHFKPTISPHELHLTWLERAAAIILVVITFEREVKSSTCVTAELHPVGFGHARKPKPDSCLAFWLLISSGLLKVLLTLFVFSKVSMPESTDLFGSE